MAGHVTVPDDASAIYGRKVIRGVERRVFVGMHHPAREKFHIRDSHTGELIECDKRALLGDLAEEVELMGQMVARMAADNGWTLDEARQQMRFMVETTLSADRAIEEQCPEAVESAPITSLLSGPGGPDQETAHASSNPGRAPQRRAA